MKTAALLLSATLMTVGGAWVQAQSTTNVNQTGNHVNNRADPGQQSDQSDKLDNKGKPMPGGKMRESTGTAHKTPAKRAKRPAPAHAAPATPATPDTPPGPGTLSPPPTPGVQTMPIPPVPPTTPATMQ